MKRDNSSELAGCLGAAQADAERFYGAAPVPAWCPAPAWRPWAAAALVGATAAAAIAAAWLWPRAAAEPGPDRPPAPVAMVAAAQLPALAAPAVPIEPAAPERAPATTPALPTALPPAPASEPAAALPEDLEAWALDPQPATLAADEPVPRPLVNTPVVPDEADATPADESTVEGEAGGGPAE